MDSTLPVRVAFRPPATGLARDRLFYGDEYWHIGPVPHWMEPTRTLARVGLERGVEFHTDDMVELASSDVLVFGDVPISRRELGRIRRYHPHLKLILQILETPIGRAWVFDTANHTEFDAVLSYHPGLNDRRRYFMFRIPVGGLGAREAPAGLPWSERKVACMIANVPNARPAFIRCTGAGLMLQGWRFSPSTWWNYVTESGSLYRERLLIARQCEETLRSQFDIFGPGWPGWPGGGSAEAGPNGFASARGPYLGSKLELLQRYRFTIAYENCLNDCGYVTEKLFDALLAGCVPVYLGNQSIDQLVPTDVFIDARQFHPRKELASFLAEVSESRWLQMREAGGAFMRDAAVPLFGSMQYAEAVLAAVRRVMSA